MEDFNQSKKIIFLHASAGAGKTYNLAKRYISLLLSHNNSIHVKNIVALTFTNKAAKEMRCRIIEYLKQAALSINNNIFNELQLPQEHLSITSKNLLKEIFTCYDNFNISTIDSFKNHILKSCAISIGLSPKFLIEQDYSKNLLNAIDKFLEKNITSCSSSSIIEKQYLTQNLLRNVNWIPRKQIYNEIEKVFNKVSNTGKDILFNKNFFFAKQLCNKSLKILNEANKLSKLFLMNDNIDNIYSKSINAILQYKSKNIIIANIPKIFELGYRNILISKNNTQINIQINKSWINVNKYIEDYCTFYMKHYYDVYAKIYSNVIKEFEQQSKSDNVIFLSEINKKTVDFFQEQNMQIPEIYYRLSTQYKHFLIDEFQDTSYVQWFGIKKLIEECLSTHGTLFYVGDPKQSIYAFRGVNTDIFSIVKDSFNNASINTKYLNSNFRSSKAIVNFNNLIFSANNIKRFLSQVNNINQQSKEYKQFISTYKMSQQKNTLQKHYGYISMQMIDSNSNVKHILDCIKQKFINYILDILKRFNAYDIAVLCRKNEEISQISSWLIENNFNIETNQSLNIQHNNYIKQIISLLSFINTPSDKLSFISFLLGDIFRKRTNMKIDEIEKFIFQLNTLKDGTAAYHFFIHQYTFLWKNYFEDLFTKNTYMSVYSLTISILEKFKVIENFPYSKAFIMCFLDLINTFEQNNFGLKNFLEFFYCLNKNDNSLFIKGIFSKGIKIMTVHKSKGLQFPVVILPFLKLFILRGFQNPYLHYDKNGIKLFYINKQIAKFSYLAKKLYAGEKLKLLKTELNILYVSMTRAKYELYGIIPKLRNNLIPVLFQFNNYFFYGKKEHYVYNPDMQQHDIVVDKVNLGYKTIKLGFDKEHSTLVKNSLQQLNKIVLLKVISNLITMESIPTETDIENSIKKFSTDFSSGNIKYIKSKLISIFSLKDIFKLFRCSNNNIIYNNKNIVNSFGNIFTVDKLVISSNNLIALTLKLIYFKHHILQSLSKIYSDKKICLYFLDVEKVNLYKKCL
ncbi:MAG: UvrD-helicase domain-containing protein [Endomicrobium sp.]|jgi:ATP-dependent exoDNAse (exonuclease V) beta subunit|nr:UvrD-helicase domain-containing protein [Endomicrobium sp.]